MQRSRKQTSLIYLACGAVSWLLAREMVSTIWQVLGLGLPDWMVSPADIIAAGIALSTFLLLLRSNKVGEFTNEVITELGRVVWPNRKETVMSTGVVSILVGICAVLFFLFDMLWGSLVKYFYA